VPQSGRAIVRATWFGQSDPERQDRLWNAWTKQSWYSARTPASLAGVALGPRIQGLSCCWY